MFTIIAVAVDSSEKTELLIKTGLSTRDIIVNYYFGFVPFILGFLFPLVAFISVIFFTSRMAYRSEIIAVISSGITYNRWLRPYIVGGLFLTIVFWFASQYTIPKGNQIRTAFESKYFDRNPTEYTNNTFYYLRIDTHTYIGLRYFDTSTKSAGTFFLQRVKNNQVVYNLRAENIRWDTAKRNWLMMNVVERTIDGNTEAIKFYPTKNYNLAFKPAELYRDNFLKEKLTTPKLSEHIKLEELRGTEGLNTLKVEKYRRTSISISVFILTMIGAFIAGRKIRGGSGLHLAIGIIICATFIVTDRFSTVFSVKGNFPPLLAAWVPNILFSAVAVYLYFKAPK
jgi:lipopolysaccharide export system permease protein